METENKTQAAVKLLGVGKRNVLLGIEGRYQQLWSDEKVFESDAPSCAEYPMHSVTPDELAAKVPKFYGTMAYPYVNGTPHVGHAFTISKIDFACRVARAQGKKVLYPQGFHATGMPINACADRLAKEIEMFGQKFEHFSADGLEDMHQVSRPNGHREDGAKFTNEKKSKAVVERGNTEYQFQVMLSMGIPCEDIHKFADAAHWLYHFPQAWQEALTNFGCAIDWRRSFVTTDVNPYYDSFVRWQMRRLKELGKIRFGKRYTVFSPKAGQPCLGHDRSSGEGVLSQEYIALKCKVTSWADGARRVISDTASIPSGAAIFMIAATLRPETMYGQTNLFVCPTMKYGIFQVSQSEFFLSSDRAARNMAFQGIFPAWGKVPKVAEIMGLDVIGSLVQAPLSFKREIYVLPMASIKENKGTGLVTSVPSDSPEDYALTIELSENAASHNIQLEWVCREILPIIDTPEYGSAIALKLVEKMKINSPKDAKQLAEAKALANKAGFYHGTMVYGEFDGMKVQDAKPLIRQQLLDSGDAFVYCEPESPVVSRSGDECVAAHLDQWFLTYGTDDEWMSDTLGHILDEDGLGFDTFTTATRNALEQTLGWMSEWAVTRQYGLGTQLPWDSSQLVDSLSDSTIYMAYCTIAHYLHSDIYGKQLGIGSISAFQMTDDVWDYVFALRDEPPTEYIGRPVLEAMRREFTYWYPLDVRISGKELANNHLVFFLYIHQAIWGKSAARYLPKAIRLNGHVVLNGEKMSKSKGNFLALADAIDKFAADPLRIALAESGDGVDDANFKEATANAAILKLHELKSWIRAAVTNARPLGENETYSAVKYAAEVENVDSIQRAGDKGFWDNLFESDLDKLIRQTVKEYSAMNFKAALKSGFYDFMSARDSYRAATAAAGLGMHQDSVRYYAETQALMVCVIAPHWADFIWREVLRKPSTIQNETFPTPPEPDPVRQSMSAYIKAVSGRIHSASTRQQKRENQEKDPVCDPPGEKRLNLYVAKTWPAWQNQCIEVVKAVIDGTSFNLKEVGKRFRGANKKRAMPFIQELHRKLAAGWPREEVFDRVLLFDEVAVLEQIVPLLKTTAMNLRVVKIFVVTHGPEDTKISVDTTTGTVNEMPSTVDEPEPGVPALEFTDF